LLYLLHLLSYLLNFLFIPFPTFTPSAPDIYYQIGKDNNFYSVLETPTGGNGDLKLAGDSVYYYYATIHEKPLLNGGKARTPPEIQRHLETNFLNEFIGVKSKTAFGNDIVVQDHAKTGLSIFNYYDIGWVIVHKEMSDKIMKNRTFKNFPTYANNLLSDVLDKKPDYEDAHVYAYKITPSNSTTPFIILGNQWSPLSGITRSIGNFSELYIINPNDESINVTLVFDVLPFSAPRNITIEHSDIIITEEINELPNDKWNRFFIPLTLNSGKNTIIFTSDSSSLTEPLSKFEPPLKKSLVFKQISILESFSDYKIEVVESSSKYIKLN